MDGRETCTICSNPWHTHEKRCYFATFEEGRIYRCFRDREPHSSWCARHHREESPAPTRRIPSAPVPSVVTLT